MRNRKRILSMLRGEGKPEWRKFEDKIPQLARFKCYNLKAQPKFRSTGNRPDYRGVRKHNYRDRIVIDAKYKSRLRITDVKKVHSYEGYPLYAKTSYVYIPSNCKVEPSAKQFSEEKGVVIIRSRMKKEKVRIGMIGRKKVYKW